MSERKAKFNSEKILSLSAMMISFITLIIFVHQTRLMSRQNYLSIMPYLDLSISTNTARNEFQLSLQNHGVGPAIIESVKVTLDGKTVDLRDYENYLYSFLVENIPGLDKVKDYSSSSLDKGMAIPANTTYNVFTVRDSIGFELITTGLERLQSEDLDYEIIYKSIQEERWMIHHNSEGPKKLH